MAGIKSRSVVFGVLRFTILVLVRSQRTCRGSRGL